jgi:hypothetical protein
MATASFQPTFKTGTSSEYVPNSIYFPTFDEALEYASALHISSNDITDYKIVESDEPPTCTWAVAKAVVSSFVRR